jgi:hypothetical protein
VQTAEGHLRYLPNHAIVRVIASVWFSRLENPCPSAGVVNCSDLLIASSTLGCHD